MWKLVSRLNVLNRYACSEYLRWICKWIPSVSLFHYSDATMTTMASQITSLTIVYSIIYSCADQRKHQTSASLAFVRGIHRWPVNFPHKGPVTRKMFPFDDVIMFVDSCSWWRHGMEIISPITGLCVGNHIGKGKVMQSFDVSFVWKGSRTNSTAVVDFRLHVGDVTVIYVPDTAPEQDKRPAEPQTVAAKPAVSKPGQVTFLSLFFHWRVHSSRSSIAWITLQFCTDVLSVLSRYS